MSRAPQDPWDLTKVLRMRRRAGFGIPGPKAARSDRWLRGVHNSACLKAHSRAPTDVRRAVIDAFSEAMFESYRSAQHAELDPIRMAWFYRLIFSAWPLRERMVLAWHNHYATSEQRVYEKETLVEGAPETTRAVARPHQQAPPGDAAQSAPCCAGLTALRICGEHRTRI